MSGSEKFLWVCELNKENSIKKWKAGDIMELEDDEDKDFVINSLILKTAVLGSKAIDGERNIVAIKTKGYQDKEFEQPIFSLTLGRNDMVSGLDLILASDHNPEVEFKLIEGNGPVYITCTHMLELPSQDDQPTIMTATDVDESFEADQNKIDEDLDAEQDEEEESEEEKVKTTTKRTAAVIKNGTAKNGKLTNGKSIEAQNGAAKEEIEAGEKPNKRKRN